MGVRLSEDEAWAELDAAHTGILTTLRRDGWPVSLPVWFATIGRQIYVRTRPRRARSSTCDTIPAPPSWWSGARSGSSCAR
ncbi:MAG TPA: pyridoxamine 5'-phosphate oxidase family protein [Acidimicrobiia bacterium]|nr:pyridoxamine 5'-phosphate oxidase family protein [Acidimicrobiia bacterium]